jgi:hypothetical protein
MLDMPGPSESSLYHQGFKTALVLSNAPEEEPRLRPVLPAVSKRKHFVTRYISRISPDDALDTMIDELSSETRIASFPNIKTVYLAYNSSRMLIHCPNVEALVMEDSPDDNEDRMRMENSIKEFTRLRALSLPEAADKSTLKGRQNLNSIQEADLFTGLLKICPNIEELSLYPPMKTGVSFADGTVFHYGLDVHRLQVRTRSRGRNPSYILTNLIGSRTSVQGV